MMNQTAEIIEYDTEQRELQYYGYSLSPETVKKMVDEYRDVKVIPGNKESYKSSKSVLMTVVHTRTGVERRRKELNEEAQVRIRQVNSVAKSLVAPLEPLEARLKLEIKAEDDRKAAIKAEEDRKERERVEAIKVKIARLGNVVDYLDKTSSQMEEILAHHQAYVIDETEFMEFITEAKLSKMNTIKVIQEIIKTKRIQEKEAEDRKQQEERLAKERQKLEEERKQIEAEKARLRLEQEKKEAKDNLVDKPIEEVKPVLSQEIETFTGPMVDAEYHPEEISDKQKLLDYVAKVRCIDIPIGLTGKAGEIFTKAVVEINIVLNLLVLGANNL
jgi:chromosome segregation ATPase